MRRAIDFAERLKALTGCDRLPWHIVQQQEQAKWDDAVVERCREIDDWSAQCVTDRKQERSLAGSNPFFQGKVATLCPQFESADPLAKIVATVWRRLKTPQLPKLILSLSWSHHREVMGACERPAERYFYIVMAVRERWSVREFRRLIDSALFLRCRSVKRAPVRVGSFGERFTKRLSHGVKLYCAALDQQVKLARENPSIGLVLCKPADSAQVRLVLTAAAGEIAVATYQTGLTDEKLIRQRLEQLPMTEETKA